MARASRSPASASLSALDLARPLVRRSSLVSICAMSASASSKLMTEMSERGSTLPSTWMTSSSSKHRTTWTMASHSRMLARNLLPRPAPSAAPLTRPAMSTNSTVVGTMLSLEVPDIAASAWRRSSGTGTMPLLGSMVQKG